MGLIRKTGLWMASWAWVRRALVDEANLEIFTHKPSVRMFIGLGILALSMIMGWPAVAALGAIGIYLDRPLIALVGGPLIYGISWVVYGLAFVVAGRDLLRYGQALNRWLARKMVLAMVGDFPIALDDSTNRDEQKQIDIEPVSAAGKKQENTTRDGK